MTAALAQTFADVGAALAFGALLLPIALFVRGRAAERPDLPQALAVGIAAVAVAVVAAGLALSVFDAIGAVGWFAVVAAIDVVLLAGAPDRPAVARRALPLLLTMLALAGTVGAVALSHSSASDAAGEARFTQLWLVPRPAGDRAQLGIRNDEGAPVTYRLTVSGPPSVAAPPVSRTVRLDPGRTYLAEVVLPRTPLPERVDVELFRDGSPTAYRSVHAWTRGAP